MRVLSRDQLSVTPILGLRKVYRRRQKLAARKRRFRTIFAKYKSWTMMPEMTYLNNLELANTHLRQHHLYNGCVVECGTWRGGMSFGLVEALPQIQEFHCFDSFQGLPKASPLDGDSAQRLQEEGRLFAVNNIASLEEFNAGLRLLEEGQRERVHTHAGWFKETMPGFVAERPISLLRIDCDWYESVMLVLDLMFDQVQPNGLIVIDDYMHWEGCALAVHDYLSRRKARERIQQTGLNGITFIVKEPA